MSKHGSPWPLHKSFSTSLHELPPPLRPVGELLGIGLLDLGTLLYATHHVIAESMAILDSLYCTLVVPHLRNIEPFEIGKVMDRTLLKH